MRDEACDDPPALQARDGLVLLHGNGAEPLCLTPDAAQRLSRDLLRAAADASWQRMQGDIRTG